MNIIKEAKKKCDFLIVAVSNDKLAKKLKNKKPVIPFKERYLIIKSLKYVDKVVEEKVDDKILANINLILFLKVMTGKIQKSGRI